MLEREEFLAAAKARASGGRDVKTGDDARDWLIAQGEGR